MSVQTVCHHCEQTIASRTCPQCGAAVCDRHFDDGRGICSVCAGESSMDLD